MAGIYSSSQDGLFSPPALSPITDRHVFTAGSKDRHHPTTDKNKQGRAETHRRSILNRFTPVEMWRLKLSVALFQLAYASSCPPTFELVRDGECRGFMATLKIPLDEGAPKAIDTCATIQGKPVIIHDSEHQEYWRARAPQPPAGYLILGIVCNAKTKRYEWADGTKIDFKPILEGWAQELDNNNCVLGIYSFDLYPNGYWGYGNRGAVSQVSVYCTTQLAPPPQGADGCDNFADDEEDGVCYQVAATAINFQDANMVCKKAGAELASVHNKQENNFIRRLAVTRGASNGVFIGATAQKDGSFAWTDGTSMDYENYYPGFPKKNFGDCVAMDTSSSAGQWMNTDCAQELPVACIRQQGSSDGPTCTGEDHPAGTIIVSPGFPSSSSTPCDYFLSVEQGKKVQMEIIMLEANSCCDSLVIYDGYLGGEVMATLSGSLQNVTYTTKTSNIMRVSWQPNGGVNVRGLAITYRAV